MLWLNRGSEICRNILFAPTPYQTSCKSVLTGFQTLVFYLTKIGEKFREVLRDPVG